jgi:hypothetical protein
MALYSRILEPSPFPPPKRPPKSFRGKNDVLYTSKLTVEFLAACDTIAAEFILLGCGAASLDNECPDVLTQNCGLIFNGQNIKAEF